MCSFHHVQSVIDSHFLMLSFYSYLLSEIFFSYTVASIFSPEASSIWYDISSNYQVSGVSVDECKDYSS